MLNKWLCHIAEYPWSPNFWLSPKFNSSKEITTYGTYFNALLFQVVAYRLATQPFDLDNRVKLEYYRLEKTYEGAIELEATPGSWKPTQPKRAGGQKDRLSPLDEIIARINEDFFGDFTDADRVMVDTLYTKMRKDAKVRKAAKSNDRQIYERSIFSGIFDTTAQQAYMENTEAYEQLFLDAEKYRIIQQVLAERLYRELHGDSK